MFSALVSLEPAPRLLLPGVELLALHPDLAGDRVAVDRALGSDHQSLGHALLELDDHQVAEATEVLDLEVRCEHLPSAGVDLGDERTRLAVELDGDDELLADHLGVTDPDLWTPEVRVIHPDLLDPRADRLGLRGAAGVKDREEGEDDDDDGLAHASS